MTLTLTTKKTIDETINIDVPCFLKRDNKFLAVFEESEVVEVCHGHGSFMYISAGTIEYYKSGIATGGWENSNEQEFRIEYDKALKQMALPKHQITTAELAELYAPAS